MPTYQDNTADENIRGQIIASGAFLTTAADRADLILAVNTPKDGITPEAESLQNTTVLNPTVKTFLQDVQNYINKKKPVAIADISYANGADNALLQELVSSGG